MTWSRGPLIATLLLTLSACGDAGSTAVAARAILPAESIDESAPVVTDAVSSTTAAPPATVARTAPPSTSPPTVVVTLPQPLPPPEPRADEPYVELGTVEIPAIGLSQPLLEGISLNTLDLGPGHWPGTAMPGQLGNVVVAGHRTSHGKVFRDIDRLVAGDEVVFTTGEGRFVYRVTGTTVVEPDAIHIIDQTEAHTGTLFACHPPGSTRQRIVVHLELDPGADGG